jgi:hypothetical protein
MSGLFKRQTLDQLCDVPDEIIDVYVVERHIWQGGSVAEETESKRLRRAEPRTVRDFLIDPVRSLLNDVLRQLAMPYSPTDKTNPIGQGWWIQAEFGSGKSHLLSVVGALALGDKKFLTWRPRTRRVSESRSTTSTRTASPRSPAASQRASSLP